MQNKNLSIELDNLSVDAEVVASLLGAFEHWFDEGFKTNEAQRTFSEGKSADLWAESTDYAAVFDVAMEKLFKLNRSLKELNDKKENAA